MSNPILNHMVKSQDNPRLTKRQQAMITPQPIEPEVATTRTSKKLKRVLKNKKETETEQIVDPNRQSSSFMEDVEHVDSLDEQKSLNVETEQVVHAEHVVDNTHATQPILIASLEQAITNALRPTLPSDMPCKLPKVELKKLAENSKIEEIDSWLDQTEEWCMRYGLSVLHTSAADWAWANARVEPTDVPLDHTNFNLQEPAFNIRRKLKNKPRRLHIIYRELLRTVIPQTAEAQALEVQKLSRPSWAQRDRLADDIALWEQSFFQICNLKSQCTSYRRVLEKNSCRARCQARSRLHGLSSFHQRTFADAAVFYQRSK
eukprot:Selendium_serpulae@DN6463_c0_g1_i12.p1